MCASTPAVAEQGCTLACEAVTWCRQSGAARVSLRPSRGFEEPGKPLDLPGVRPPPDDAHQFALRHVAQLPAPLGEGDAEVLEAAGCRSATPSILVAIIGRSFPARPAVVPPGTVLPTGPRRTCGTAPSDSRIPLVGAAANPDPPNNVGERQVVGRQHVRQMQTADQKQVRHASARAHNPRESHGPAGRDARRACPARRHRPAGPTRAVRAGRRPQRACLARLAGRRRDRRSSRRRGSRGSRGESGRTRQELTERGTVPGPSSEPAPRSCRRDRLPRGVRTAPAGRPGDEVAPDRVAPGEVSVGELRLRDSSTDQDGGVPGVQSHRAHTHRMPPARAWPGGRGTRPCSLASVRRFRVRVSPTKILEGPVAIPGGRNPWMAQCPGNGPRATTDASTRSAMVGLDHRRRTEPSGLTRSKNHLLRLHHHMTTVRPAVRQKPKIQTTVDATRRSRPGLIPPILTSHRPKPPKHQPHHVKIPNLVVKRLPSQALPSSPVLPR